MTSTDRLRLTKRHALRIVAVLLVMLCNQHAGSIASGDHRVEWLVVGPFDKGAGSTWIDRDFLEDAGGESRVKPALDQIAGGKQWKRIVSSHRLDLIDALGPHQDAIAYVARSIHQPEAGMAALRIDHDDGAVLWINGQRIGVYGIGKRVVPVRLDAGKNLILAKVSQGGGGWHFGVEVERFIRTELSIFTPNGDGVNDELEIYLAVDNPTPAEVHVRDATNRIVRTLRTGEVVRGVNDAVVWDGRNNAGDVVPNGQYTVVAMVKDGRPHESLVTVRKALTLQRRDYKHLDTWFATGVFYDGNWIPPTPEAFRAQCRDMREHHMDTIVFTNTHLQRDNVVDSRGRNWMLDVAAEEGMKVVLPVYHGPLGGFIRGETDMSEYTAMTPLRTLARDVSNYPAVVAYITADEPPLHMADRLHVASRVFQHVDPLRPAFPIIVGLDRTWVHQRTSHYPILFIDPYAASYGRPEGDFTMSGFGYPHLDLGEYIDFARITAGDRARVWTLLQTHSFAQQLREPTPNEVRAMSWIALAHGSKGLFYFVYQSQQGWRGLVHESRPSDRYLAAAEVAKKLRGPLGNTIMSLNYISEPAAISDSHHPTDVQTFQHSTTGEKYLVIVNLDVKTSGESTVRLLNPTLRPVDVVRDQQPVRIDGDTYVIHWTQPGEGTVLRLAPIDP